MYALDVVICSCVTASLRTVVSNLSVTLGTECRLGHSMQEVLVPEPSRNELSIDTANGMNCLQSYTVLPLSLSLLFYVPFCLPPLFVCLSLSVCVSVSVSLILSLSPSLSLKAVYSPTPLSHGTFDAHLGFFFLTCRHLYVAA